MERGAYDQMRALEDHHWWFRGKRRMLAPLIRRATARGGRLVDVGCGTGAMLAFVAQRAPDVARLGLDFDAGALRYTGERRVANALVRGDGARLPFGDASLECVMALDIIEHFEDEAAVIAELHRVLAPGGELVASVPMYPWLWSPHDEFLHHKRRYRSGELQRKLRAAGFEIAESHGFNFLLLPAIALVRLVKGRRQKASGAAAEGTDFFELPAPLNACLAGLFAVEDWITRVLPVPFGVSMLIRARRAA